MALAPAGLGQSHRDQRGSSHTDLGKMSELRMSTLRLGGSFGMGGSSPRERDLPFALRLWPWDFAVRLLFVSRSST